MELVPTWLKVLIWSGSYLLTVEDYTTGCPKTFYLILELNFGEVNFSMTKILRFPDFRDMYKSLLPKLFTFMCK